MHPSLDIGNASLVGRNSLMKVTKMAWGVKLIVIREAVMKQRMGIDNSRERLNVQNEDNWSKNWPLRVTKLEDSWKGFSAIYGNCLGVIGEVGMEPGENRARKTKRSVEIWQKNGMISGVKSSRQIEKRQEQKFIIVLRRSLTILSSAVLVLWQAQ